MALRCLDVHSHTQYYIKRVTQDLKKHIKHINLIIEKFGIEISTFNFKCCYVNFRPM